MGSSMSGLSVGHEHRILIYLLCRCYARNPVVEAVSHARQTHSRTIVMAHRDRADVTDTISECHMRSTLATTVDENTRPKPGSLPLQLAPVGASGSANLDLSLCASCVWIDSIYCTSDGYARLSSLSWGWPKVHSTSMIVMRLLQLLVSSE